MTSTYRRGTVVPRDQEQRSIGVRLVAAWRRPNIAGIFLGDPRTGPDGRIGTVADVGTDGDGNAVAVLLAFSPDERVWCAIAGVAPP